MKLTWKMFNDEVNRMIKEANNGIAFSLEAEPVLTKLRNRLRERFPKAKRKRCKNCLCILFLSSVDSDKNKEYIHYAGKVCRCGCVSPEPEKEAKK